MNNTMRRVIMDRRRRNDYAMDYRRGDRARGRDYNDYDYEYERDDGRQGVKGTGRYGIGGSRYYGDRNNEDYNYDYARNDYGHEGGGMRLSKREMMDWKERMENADGSYGEHFTGGQIKQAAQQMGVEMKGFNDKELCLAANMLYSDYGEVLRPFIPKEKEAYIYTNLAKAFLEDDDAAVKGGEKLACYYYAMVDDDNEG